MTQSGLKAGSISLLLSPALLPYLLPCAAGEPNVTLTRLYSSQQTGARNYV